MCVGLHVTMLFPEPIFPQQPPEDEKFTVLCLEHRAVCIHREELRLFDKALKLLGSASIRRPFQFRYFCLEKWTEGFIYRGLGGSNKKDIIKTLDITQFLNSR